MAQGIPLSACLQLKGLLWHCHVIYAVEAPHIVTCEYSKVQVAACRAMQAELVDGLWRLKYQCDW